MKIVFMGTPDFAVPALKALIDNKYEIVGAFCQPDKPKGRSGKLQAPPVKILAEEYGIPIFQFDKIRSEEGTKALKDLNADLGIVAAFGQILSQENLDSLRLGCINIHGSLLPKYRGSAPIQWSVINGDDKTGVTIMKMKFEMDAGDMLYKKELPIEINQTSGEIFDAVSQIGAKALTEALELMEKNQLEAVKQDEKRVTFCEKLTKEHGKIDFSKSSMQIHNLVRGVNPWPGAYAQYNNEIIKIWKTKLTSLEMPGEPGAILIADAKKGLFIKTGDGAIELCEIQAPGGKRMESAVYLRGKPITIEEKFN